MGFDIQEIVGEGVNVFYGWFMWEEMIIALMRLYEIKMDNNYIWWVGTV